MLSRRWNAELRASVFARLASASASAWLGLAAVLAATSAIRWRLLGVPLERDEGEYAYAGQLLLEGIPPFESVYTMKFAGIHAVYSMLLAVGGPTPSGIRLGLLCVNAATTVLVFGITRRLFGPLPALASAGAFALLSLGPAVHGVFANAEHFVLLPGLTGLWLLLVDRKVGWRLALGGALLGCSFVIKQHGFVFPLMAATYLVIQGWKKGTRPADVVRSLAVLTSFGLLPFLGMLGWMWWSEVWDTFWFWTFRYGIAYAQQVTGEQAWTLLRSSVGDIAVATPGLWVLAAFGLTTVVWETRAREAAPFLVPLFVLSIAAVCPGLFFRPHYFVLLLPAAAIAVGAAVHGTGVLGGRWGARIPATALALVLVGVGLAHGLASQRAVLLEMPPRQVVQWVFGRSNPFAESPDLARLIHERTEPEDRIAVLGSEPQLFFYSQRKSATGYIYTYPLVERQPYAQRMQEEMIAEIEAAEPRVLVFVRSNYSWLRKEGAPRVINQWFRRYSKGFDLLAVAPLGRSELRLWTGKDLEELDPLPRPNVEIYLRSSSAKQDPEES